MCLPNNADALAVVTTDQPGESGKALLWTDGRYWIQAEREVDCNWDLMRFGMSFFNTVIGLMTSWCNALVSKWALNSRKSCGVNFIFLSYQGVSYSLNSPDAIPQYILIDHFGNLTLDAWYCVVSILGNAYVIFLSILDLFILNCSVFFWTCLNV